MLQDEDKVHQEDFVPTLVLACNCTKTNAMEFSPYYLMFGWKPWLGLNLQFGLLKEEQVHQANHDYVSQLEEKLHWAYNLATETQDQEGKQHERQYDWKIRSSQLEPGDHVLLLWKGFQAKDKIVDQWENITYEVIKKLTDVPIYIICKFPKMGEATDDSHPYTPKWCTETCGSC